MIWSGSGIVLDLGDPGHCCQVLRGWPRVSQPHFGSESTRNDLHVRERWACLASLALCMRTPASPKQLKIISFHLVSLQI